MSGSPCSQGSPLTHEGRGSASSSLSVTLQAHCGVTQKFLPGAHTQHSTTKEEFLAPLAHFHTPPDSASGIVAPMNSLLPRVSVSASALGDRVVLENTPKDGILELEQSLSYSNKGLISAS